MIPEKERMRLPGAPPAARRPGIPVIAILAPLLMAGALWVMTSSAYALLFAFLGPVIAIAGWLDGRRGLRGDRRTAVREALRRLDELTRHVDERADDYRLRLHARTTTHPSPLSSDLSGSSSIVLRLGTGDLPSGLELDADVGEQLPELAAAIAAFRERAAFIRNAPVLVEEQSADILATGPDVLVRAFARSLVIQAVASCAVEDTLVQVPAGETWTRDLPHEVKHADHWEVRSGDRRLLLIRRGAEPAGSGRVSVSLGDDSGAPARVEAPHRVEVFQPVLASSAEAWSRVEELARRARRDGWRPASGMPDTVSFASLAGDHDHTAGVLAAPVGRDGDGIVHLDLERDGPHALVAGTTGSGKSELLVTWVLALARDHAPRDLGFLLIDFKGGAAFAPLRDLPHVVGMVSDLDPVAAARAVESLRAELRRREERLASHAVRSIAEMPPGSLSRLVIVVDEFAALVSLDAGLQAVFADLAARGRSLGLHLIVCTQRPAGIVRESVLANVTLRICLRVLEAADSTAVIGHPDAAAIGGDARGRGLLADGRHARAVQFALTEPSDAETIRARWAEHPKAEGRPWLDPLPPVLRAADLPAFLPSTPDHEGILIGAVDRPAQQRQDQLLVDPWGSGALLVLGSTGSGRSTALEMVAHAADADVRRVPNDPAELWQALSVPAGSRRVLVIADDLDRTFAWADSEQRADLGELLSRAARDTRRSGIAVVASARSSGGALHGVQLAFEQRIILRLASREEHLLAGGELAGFRTDRRPGSCLWRESEAQIALPPAVAHASWQATLPVVDVTTGGWSIVTPRAGELVVRLAEAGVAACAPTAVGASASPRVAVADTDGWLMEHAALGSARRGGRLLLIGCTASDHRTLTRMRSALPPLSGDDEAWLFDGVTTTRVRVQGC